MRRSLLSLATSGLFFVSLSASAQTNACDLTGDGKVDASDVQAAINMTLGMSPCTANIIGVNVCNIVMVQRIINATLGSPCVTSTSHSVTLNWLASVSTNVTSYNVYRGTTAGGPYTLVASAGAATTFTDSSVVAGVNYYYVMTSVDSSNNESAYSSEAPALIPTP